MSRSAIRGVKARAIVVPLKRPLKNAFGVFEAAPLVLIDVEPPVRRGLAPTCSR